MSANLKTGEDFLKDKEGIGSLFDRGFTVVRNAAQELDLLSSEGEVVCTMKDGVEYVLRFGDLQVTADKQEATVAEGDAPDGGSVNRYLFVMVRMNENAVDRPELEDLPDLPDSTSAPAASAAGEESEDSSEADDAEADDADDDTEVSAENDGNTNESEDEAGDTDGDSEDAPPADADNADGDETAAIIAERKEIETQNQRKLDEYQSKLEAGRKNVEELNTRFGDWYYVISNDVFQKVHLGREDVVKEKAASGEDASTDVDVSEFGAPGAALPGVPGIPGVEGDEEQ
jgi:hypothetical protein